MTCTTGGQFNILSTHRSNCVCAVVSCNEVENRPHPSPLRCSELYGHALPSSYTDVVLHIARIIAIIHLQRVGRGFLVRERLLRICEGRAYVEGDEDAASYMKTAVEKNHPPVLTRIKWAQTVANIKGSTCDDIERNTLKSTQHISGAKLCGMPRLMREYQPGTV